MIGKILFNINQNFGRYFFKNPNNFYNIFNISHRFLISRNTDNPDIKKFLNHGFLKQKFPL